MARRAREPGATIGDPVLWHEAECGGYAADLAIWERLARGRRQGRCSTSARAAAGSACIWRGAATR